MTTYNTVPPPNFDEPIAAEDIDNTKKSKKKKRKHEESLIEADDVVKTKKTEKTKDDGVNEVECNVTTINHGGLVSEEVAVEKSSLLSKVLKKKKKKQKYTITDAPETTTVTTDIVPAETPVTEADAVVEVVTENQIEESTDVNAEKPKKKKKKSKKSIEESAPLVEAVTVQADIVVTNNEKM